MALNIWAEMASKLVRRGIVTEVKAPGVARRMFTFTKFYLF
jgi:hypothetical protein